MVAKSATDNIGVGLDDGAWENLPREFAESLLRACRLPLPEERTYSSVQILPTPCGEDLYVRSSLFG